MAFLKKHKNDILLILAVLLVAGGLLLWQGLSQQAGTSVEVTVDDEVLMTLPLREDTSVVIGEGDHTNRLVIENGEARVTEASCPDHVCMDRGAIHYDGETIVCLPNRLVIAVKNGADGGMDAVSQ